MNYRRVSRVPLLILVHLLAVPRLFADSVDDYLREQMNARHIPGLVRLVLPDVKVIKQQSYGLANVELEVPISPKLAGIGLNRRQSASCDEIDGPLLSFSTHLLITICHHLPGLA